MPHRFTSIRWLIVALACLSTSVGFASSTAMLDLTAHFKPVLALHETYTEKPVNNPNSGPTVVDSGSSIIRVVASMAGVDLTQVGSDMQIGLDFGSFSHSDTLSNSVDWVPGKNKASFVITDGNGHSGRIVYSWNANKLVVIAIGKFPFLDATVYMGSVGTSTRITDVADVTVTFGDSTGTHQANVGGVSTERAKQYVSGEVDYQTAVLAAAGDYHGPFLKILSPKPALRTRAETLPLTIAAPTADGIDVEVYVNAVGPVAATHAATAGRWTASVSLSPGPNDVVVTAVDNNNNGFSIKDVNVDCLVSGTLAVAVSGQGTVPLKYRGTTHPLIGFPVSITATPARGQVFAGWTGDFSSSSPTITFTMEPSTSLTATFVPNPFPSVSGTYSGTFTDDSSGRLTGGISLVVSTNGAVTGTLLVHGISHPFQGRFTPDGNATFQINSDLGGGVANPELGMLELDLSLDMTNGSGSLSGVVTEEDDYATATLNSQKTVFSASNPIPGGINGNYTFTFAGDNQLGGSGTNTAVATATVSTSGVVRISGLVATGSTPIPFSATGVIASDFTCHFYAPLFMGSKSITGEIEADLTFEGLGASDADGTATLIVDTDGNSSIIALDVLGSLYQAPVVDSHVLSNLDSDGGQADFSFGGNDEAISISSLSQVTFPSGNDSQVSMKINAATGLFNGMFFDSALGAKVPFYGVFFQDTQQGIGFYLGSLPDPNTVTTLDSGDVFVTPN